MRLQNQQTQWMLDKWEVDGKKRKQNYTLPLRLWLPTARVRLSLYMCVFVCAYVSPSPNNAWWTIKDIPRYGAHTLPPETQHMEYNYDAHFIIYLSKRISISLLAVRLLDSQLFTFFFRRFLTHGIMHVIECKHSINSIVGRLHELTVIKSLDSAFIWISDEDCQSGNWINLSKRSIKLIKILNVVQVALWAVKATIYRSRKRVPHESSWRSYSFVNSILAHSIFGWIRYDEDAVVRLATSDGYSTIFSGIFLHRLNGLMAKIAFGVWNHFRSGWKIVFAVHIQLAGISFPSRRYCTIGERNRRHANSPKT